jgi:hypothetical protein
MGLGLLKFLVFVQLVIAVAFFSGHVTADQITDTLARAEHAATVFYGSVAARASSALGE